MSDISNVVINIANRSEQNLKVGWSILRKKMYTIRVFNPQM